MIAADTFPSTFGLLPPGADVVAHLPGIVRHAVRHGYAIVPVAAGGKVPICTLSARQAKAADLARQAELRDAGRSWQRAKHECGLAHALTDPATADRVIKRLVKERGPVNIGVEVGRSRMLLVDADTDEQVKAYAAACAAQEPGIDATALHPTVSTPGVMTYSAETGEELWVHKHGAHYWYTDDTDLVSLPGPGSLVDAAGWTACWRDHQALVPPSRRPEGPYTLVGAVRPVPGWLATRIRDAARTWSNRRAEQAARVRHEGDPIDVWSAVTGWAALLEPDGWTATGKPDRCGCPIWTRPGEAAHYKSATAHELACTRFDVEADRGGPLHVWSDNPPQFLAEATALTGTRTFSKLQYVGWRDHCGNMGAAMAALELDALGDDCASVRADLLASLDEMAGGRPTIDMNASTATATTTAPGPQPAAGEHAAPEPGGDAAPDGPPVAEQPAGDASISDPEPVAEPGDEFAAELAADKRLLFEVRRLRIADRARHIVARLNERTSLADAERRMTDAWDVADALPEDPDDEPWRVRDLWMRGQVVMLSAKYKSGKTTMVLNVARSLVDGKPFLGQFGVEPLTGNLVIVNAEMTRRQFRQWLRDAPIDNRDKVHTLHVRQAGTAAGDIVSEARRELLIKQLRGRETQALILDPLNPLLSASGVEENASSEVAGWFNALADVVRRAGIEDVLLVHHFGHVGERGRGSSKFMDAPDAIWTYTTGELPIQPGAADDDADEPDLLCGIDVTRPRYLSAIGRDVDLPKSRVTFDPATRLLSMPAVGDAGPARRAVTEQKAEDRRQALTERIERTVASRPPSIAYGDLYDVVGGNKTEFRNALDALRETGRVAETPGPRRARMISIAGV